tara:strand:- start:6 stop:752 length:747 start_codon:yes stop_codon:yes gene_type:complete
MNSDLKIIITLINTLTPLIVLMLFSVYIVYFFNNTKAEWQQDGDMHSFLDQRPDPNNPLWKTNILAIDLIVQFIFIFILIFIVNLLNNNISTHTMLIIISIFMYSAMGVIRWGLMKRGINEKGVITGKNKWKLSEKWWHSYAGDIMFGLTVPMLLIICIINKKYNYCSFILLYIIAYFSTDSIYTCLSSSPVGDGTAIGMALSVYILLIIQYSKSTSKFLYPLISTIVVIISYIFRSLLGKMVSYLCI